MKKDVEFIRQESSDKECYICKGKDSKCNACGGSGVFTDNHYIMVANGIAFGVDTIK